MAKREKRAGPVSTETGWRSPEESMESIVVTPQEEAEEGMVLGRPGHRDQCAGHRKWRVLRGSSDSCRSDRIHNRFS